MSSHNKYGPIRGDKVHFISNHDIDDSQIEDLRFAPHKEKTINIACFRVSRKSCLRTLIAVLCITLLIIVIILIAKATHHNGPEEAQKPIFKSSNYKDFGLFYYPQNPNTSPIVRFEPLYKSYEKLMDQLHDTLHKYTLTEQLGTDFIDCDPTNHPQDKVCRMPIADLGKECSHRRFYGYDESRPCILLMLKLNQTEIPQPYMANSSYWSKVERVLGGRYSQDHIGITCDGDTDFDRKNILTDPVTHKSIVYSPEKGFPTYFFPPSENEKYLPPVVMVQFNRLTLNVPVNIKCVAWAENFNNGHPQSSEKYTASFEITINS